MICLSFKKVALCLSVVICFGVFPAVAAEWTMMESPVGVTLKAVWGTSTENVIAVGSGATVLHFNGSDWTKVPVAESITSNLISVHGSSASNIVVVGNGGTILKYNGSLWSVANSGVTYNLNSVWVSSASEFFIATESGKILQCDTVQCNEKFTDITDSLNGIWGTSADNIYAVGSNGIILHNDGGSHWEPMESPTEENLNAIWGSSENNIIAVGDKGTIIHFNGTAWSDKSIGTSKDLSDVGGSTDPNIYAVGEELKLYSYSSSSWTSMANSISAQIDPITNLSGVWVSQTSDAFIVGEKGTILLLSENISAQNTPPTAVFTVTPESGEVGETFFVDSSDSFDAQDNQSELEYSWNWGDGSDPTDFSSAAITSHEYTADGTYTITLNVRDTGGLTGSASQQVTVGTGEPSSCPAQQLIEDEKSLEIMRAFRDEVLSRSSAGRQLIRIYYRNAGSAVEMLEAHPALAEAARIVLQSVIPAMKLAVE